jgi:hypothetical protein
VDSNVAEIDGTKYATLQAAINAAEQTATTIQLLESVSESVTIASGQNIILDLNGQTLTAPAATADGVATGAIQNNGTLEIKDGSTDEKGTITTADQTSYLVYMQTGGTLTITSGNFTAGTSSLNSLIWVTNGTVNVNGGAFTGAGNGNNQYLVQVYSSNASASITGGEFTPAAGKYAINAGNNATATITGGTYTVSGSQYIAYDKAKIETGYEATDNSDGTYTVAQMSNAKLCIGTQSYYDLATAISAADGTASDPTVITLLGDVTENVTVASGKCITLDLNGHTLTSTTGTTITNNGSLTIKDSKTGGTVACGTGRTASLVKSTNVLTIENGIFKSTVSAAVTVTGGQVRISGGTFTGSTSGVLTSNCTVEIIGGQFTGTSTAGVTVGNSSIATISGGNFAGAVGLKAANVTSLTISGGTFSSEPDSAYLMTGYVATENGGTYTVAPATGTVAGLYSAEGTLLGMYTDLQKAIDAATSTDVVQLVSNVELTSTLQIKNSVTIDGQGLYTISAASSLATNVKITGSENVGSPVAVTLQNITLTNSNSGAVVIVTEGTTSAPYLTLTLDSAKVDATGSGYTYAIRVNGDTRNTSYNTKVTIKDSTLTTKGSGKAVRTMNPVDLTIDNSTLSGYAALYLGMPNNSAGADGSTVTIKNESVLTGTNNWSGGDDSFGTIVLENVGGYTEGVKIDVTDSTLNAVATGTATQGVIYYSNYSSTASGNNSEVPYGTTVNISGTSTVNLTGSTAKLVAYDYQENSSNTTHTNVMNITGGTFTSKASADADATATFNVGDAGNLTITGATISITGGTFSSKVGDSYIAEGYGMVVNAFTGACTVAKKQAAMTEITAESTSTISVTIDDKTDGNKTISEINNTTITDVLQEVTKNEAVTNYATTSLETAVNSTDVTAGESSEVKASDAYISITPTAISVETPSAGSGEETKVTSITYDIKPMTGSGESAKEIKVAQSDSDQKFNSKINIRVPMPKAWKGLTVKMSHKTDEAQYFVVSNDCYITISADSFSEYVFALSDDVNGLKASYGEQVYASLQDAIDATLADQDTTSTLKLLATATGTVEFSGTLNVELGSYTWEATNTGNGTVNFVDVTPAERTVTASVQVINATTGQDRGESSTTDGITTYTAQAGDTVEVSFKISNSYLGADIIVGFNNSVLKLNKDGVPADWTEYTATRTGVTKQTGYTYYEYNVTAHTSDALTKTDIGTFSFTVVKQTSSNPVTTEVDYALAQISATATKGATTEATVTTKSDKVTVGKVTVAIPDAIAAKPYTGKAQKSGLTDTTQYTVKTDEGGTEAGGTDVNKSSSTYSVTLELADSDIYEWGTIPEGRNDVTKNNDGTLTLTYQIVKATDNKWIVDPAVADVAYGGSIAGATTHQAKYGDNTVVVTYASGQSPADSAFSTTLPTTVGKYTAKFTLPATGNYNGLTTTATFEITPADLEYTKPLPKTDLTANGENQELITEGTITTKTGVDGVKFYYAVTTDGSKPGDNAVVTDTVPEAEAVGSYVVWYKIAGNDNYNSVKWTRVGGDYGVVTISAPDYKVVATEYIPGYQMVFVFTKEDAGVKFQYDGTTLYDISGLGYKLYLYDNKYGLTSSVMVDGKKVTEGVTLQGDYTKVYAILLAQGYTYDATKLSVVSNSTAVESITLRDVKNAYDVNAATASNGSVVNVDDEVQVMGAYNARDGYASGQFLRNTFRADVDKDGAVDTADASLVHAHYD